MVLFNEITMSKATFNKSFVMSSSGYGIASDEEDSPAEDFVDTYAGQECWVLNDVKVEDCENGPLLFVYVPEYDFATTVLVEFVDKE